VRPVSAVLTFRFTLAEFQYRFNWRFNMRTILPRWLHALVAAPASPERSLRLAEVSR
jgi:hypothetical protein